jgi:hypothetical protein
MHPRIPSPPLPGLEAWSPIPWPTVGALGARNVEIGRRGVLLESGTRRYTEISVVGVERNPMSEVTLCLDTIALRNVEIGRLLHAASVPTEGICA